MAPPRGVGVGADSESLNTYGGQRAIGRPARPCDAGLWPLAAWLSTPLSLSEAWRGFAD